MVASVPGLIVIFIFWAIVSSSVGSLDRRHSKRLTRIEEALGIPPEVKLKTTKAGYFVIIAVVILGLTAFALILFSFFPDVFGQR